MNLKNIINLKIRNKLVDKLSSFSNYQINFTDYWGNWTIGVGDKTVSYTHLTLPTICSV